MIKRWDSYFEHHIPARYPCEDLIRFMANYFPSVIKPATIQVLEIGCGSGANCWYLAREGFSVIGIDQCQTAINLSLTNNIYGTGNWPKFFRANSVKDFYEDSQDCVIDIECLAHNPFKTTRKMIESVYKILKPGRFFFSKTFETCPPEWRRNMHVRLTKSREIESLYKPFEIQSVESVIKRRNGKEQKEWLIIGKK